MLLSFVPTFPGGPGADDSNNDCLLTPLIVAFSVAPIQVGDKDFGFQKSSVQEGKNPVYNQTFTFNLPTLNNMVLTCKLRDEDTASRDDKLGWCKIKLEHAGLSSTPKEFVEIVDRNLIAKQGRIHLKISWEE